MHTLTEKTYMNSDMNMHVYMPPLDEDFFLMSGGFIIAVYSAHSSKSSTHARTVLDDLVSRFFHKLLGRQI